MRMFSDFELSFLESQNNKGRAYNFVKESNKIEGIIREPTPPEIKAFTYFLTLPQLTIEDVVTFVSAIQPDAVLRNKKGLDVRVGNHFPPKGGDDIKNTLNSYLAGIKKDSPYIFHLKYETLHPFTDGNGRSGRAIWAWQMINLGLSFSLGFLHTYYYQTLEFITIEEEVK